MSNAASAEHRLATYGSLAPGRVNHHQLAGLRGLWRTGLVRGRLIDNGWGAGLGYPAIIPDVKADPVEVFIFESADLPAHWDRLDAFEGDEYQRVTVAAETETGPVAVSIYALRPRA